MNQAVMSLSRPPPPVTIPLSHIHQRVMGSFKATKPLRGFTLTTLHLKHRPVLCSKLTPWEPSPITYAAPDDSDEDFLHETPNIFESIKTETKTETTETAMDTMQSQPLKWPMWILGPCILLITGIVPTLWLPISSVFLGSNVASLLALVGLDCIFNIGATLFLLMADACGRPTKMTETCNSQAPLGYRFWNMIANIMGFVIPLTMLFASNKGVFQTQLPLISFGILLGPYLLLLAVQMLTEMLIWHWQSPIWLMTPVVYEAYRVLQLMRGLKLSGEIGAPMWTVETMRGLVSWWVLILGVQLMRVAWFAGFTARGRARAGQQT